MKFKKITTLILLVTFISTLPAPLPAHAAPVLSSSIPLSIGTVAVPEAFGKIEDRFQGNAGKTAVIIQDAHAIPEAQKNIQRLIGFFQKKYGISDIGLEGAGGKLDPQIFRSFPEPKTLRKVFRQYFRQGELTGTTAAAIFNSTPAHYYGVEDWPLYEEGLSLFLSSMNRRQEIDKDIKIWAQELQKEKEKEYPADLLEIDRTLQLLQAHQLDFLDAVKKMTSFKTPEKGTKLAALSEFLKTDGYDSRDPQLSQAALTIKKLMETGAASSDLLRKLHSKTQGYESSAISAFEYAQTLKELFERFHPLKTQAPEFKKLTGMAAVYQNIQAVEGTELLQEFEAYAERLKESFFKNNTHRALNRETRELELAGKLAALEMSRKEWSETIASAAEFRTGKQKEIWGNLKTNFDFYRNAEKRDGVFLENFEKGLPSNSETGILIAGGFHAEGLTKQLKDRKISYLLITPKIKNLPEENHYHEQMRGNVSWRNYFKSAENGLIYEAFVRAARDRLLEGQEDRRLLKYWRDQIIRDLADKNQTGKAGEYTRFLDELNQPGRSELRSYDRIKQFMSGLKLLQTESRITPENIINILKSGTMGAKHLSVLDKTSRRSLPSRTISKSGRAENRIHIPAYGDRSEMRADNPRLLRERAKKNEEGAWSLLEYFHENEAFESFFWNYVAHAPPVVLGHQNVTPAVLAERIKKLFDLWSEFKKKLESNYSASATMNIPVFTEGQPENYTEVVVIAKDRVGLLKDLSGFMAAERQQWNILREYLFTPEAGYVMAFFEIQKDEAPVHGTDLLLFKLMNAADRKSANTDEIKFEGGVSNGRGGYRGSVAVFQGFQGGIRDIAFNIFSSLSSVPQNGERARRIRQIQEDDQTHLNETVDELIQEMINLNGIFAIPEEHAAEIGDWVNHIRDQVLESTPGITVDSKTGEPKPQLSSVMRFLDLLTAEFSASKAPRTMELKALTEIEARLVNKAHGRFHLFSGIAESEEQQRDLIRAEVDWFNEKLQTALTVLRKKAEQVPRLIGLIETIEGEGGYREQIVQAIESKSISAQEAILRILVPDLEKMRSGDWAKTKDNALDLESIFTDVYLLLRGAMLKRSEVFSGETTGDIILFARGLTLLELIEKLEEFPNLKVIVTDEGTLASHGAILAGESGVPFLILPPGSLDSVLEGMSVGAPVILNAVEGSVFIRPSEETMERYSADKIMEEAMQQAASAREKEPAVTQTGARLFVRGSADQADHIAAALDKGAESIGLYRTERQFKGQILRDYLDANTPENREALKKYLRDAYLEAAKNVQEGQFITIRTYDFERDKDFGVPNPASQYGLDYYRTVQGQDLLQIQLEALLEANAALPRPMIRILFPMFRHPDDLAHRAGYKKFSEIPAAEREEKQGEFDSFMRDDVEWLSAVYETVEARVLKESERPLNIKKTQKGFMIETVEGIHVMDDLLAHSDFINVGTSDLLVSLHRDIGLSRDNQAHQAHFSEMGPRFVKAVEDILEGVRLFKQSHAEENLYFDFCGIKASDPALWLLLLQHPLPNTVFTGVSLSQDRIALAKAWVRMVDKEHLERIGSVETFLQEPEKHLRLLVGEINQSLHKSPDVMKEFQNQKAQKTSQEAVTYSLESLMGAKAESNMLDDGRLQETRLYQAGVDGIHLVPSTKIYKLVFRHKPVQLTMSGNDKKEKIGGVLDASFMKISEGMPFAMEVTGSPENVAAFFKELEEIQIAYPTPESTDLRVFKPFRPEMRENRILETIQRDTEGLTRKNTEGLIPLGVVFLHVFQALEEGGANKDFRGLEEVFGEMEIKDQIVYYKPSKLLPKAVLLGYDMDVAKKETVVGLNGEKAVTLTFIPRKNLSLRERRRIFEENPDFYPFVHDDEYPVVMEFETNPQGTALENVSAVYFGGITAGRFLKFEILEKKDGKDDWEPLDLENLLFERKSQPLIWTPDTPELSAEPIAGDHLKAFLEQLKTSSRQVLIRVTETGDPRAENRRKNNSRSIEGRQHSDAGMKGKEEAESLAFDIAVRDFAEKVRPAVIRAVNEDPDNIETMRECQLCALAAPLVTKLAQKYFEGNSRVHVEPWGGVITERHPDPSASPQTFMHFWTEIVRGNQRYYVSVMDGQLGVDEWALHPNVQNVSGAAAERKYDFLNSTVWEIRQGAAEAFESRKVYQNIGRILQRISEADHVLGHEGFEAFLDAETSRMIREGVFRLEKRTEPGENILPKAGAAETAARRAFQEIQIRGNVTLETAESLVVSDIDAVLSEMDRLAVTAQRKSEESSIEYIAKANARILQLRGFVKKWQDKHPALFAANRKAVVLVSVPKTESQTEAKMLAGRNADQAASLSGLIDSVDITGDLGTRREFLHSFNGEGLKTQTVGEIDDISSERAPVLPVVYVKAQKRSNIRRANVVHIDTDREGYKAENHEDSTEAVAEMLEYTVAVMSAVMLKPEKLKKEDLEALLKQLEEMGVDIQALFKIQDGQISAVMSQVENFIESYRAEARFAQAA